MKSGTLRSRMMTCVFSTTLVVLLFSFVLLAQAPPPSPLFSARTKPASPRFTSWEQPRVRRRAQSLATV